MWPLSQRVGTGPVRHAVEEVVEPVQTLGVGRPLFDEHDVPIELDPLEQRSFEQGVTMHRYAIHDESEASSC